MAFGEFHILSEDDIVDKMERCDVIVPRKRHYVIETVYSHYVHAHYQKDIDRLREVVIEISPSSLEAFDRVMHRRSLFLYNMFIMEYRHFNEYCAWLFSLLFEVERCTNISEYDSYQRRVFGFLGERLFNVWLEERQLRVCEVNVVNLEGEPVMSKAIAMLKRKFMK
jgi:hypothetical protein